MERTRLTGAFRIVLHHLITSARLLLLLSYSDVIFDFKRCSATDNHRHRQFSFLRRPRYYPA